MKKTNIIGMLMIFLMASLVLAGTPTMPAPVKGRILLDGVGISGYNVEITNERTGETLTYLDEPTLITYSGWYTFDMSDFSLGYAVKSDFPVYEGDTITVRFGIEERSFKANNFPYQLEDIIVGELPEQPDEPEPEVEEITLKVTSNSDKSAASIDVLYGQEINLKVGNNKIAKLLDTEIEFNDKDYDVKEEILIKGSIQTSIDEVDYGLTPYLVIDEIGYNYIFLDEIDLNEITKDETLIINLLGKEYEIIDASSDEITYLTSDKYDVTEGEVIKINDKDFKILAIGEGFVRVSYDGAIENINEGDTETVSDVEVYVSETMEDDDVVDFAVLRIGSEVENTIENGDEYDEVYEWVIDLDASPQIIGIINDEDFSDLEEDNKPLKPGDVISIADYIDIKLSDGIIVYIELEIRAEDEGLRVDGDLSSGTEDYDEVYIKSDGIYDEDDYLIGTSIQIGDSDINLELGSLKIGDLTISLDMSDILLNGISYALKDEDFMDYLGLIFRDPEAGVEDKKNFEVSVPEERPELTITLGTELPEDEEEEECEDVPQNETVCPDYPICPTTDCPDVVVCDECPTDEDRNNTIAWIIGSLVSILFAVVGVVAGGFSWFPGMKGISNYYMKEGLKALREGKYNTAKKKLEQAFNTMKTITEKAKNEEYGKG